ncbi:PREDICTED: neuronal PAS domain-containing protein 2-like [Priapulus caudatus]|uniref:Neuronal PAS domain-containing protein 2-like n=1 Tax=Priapulus caudatus TaxID=37621 RepID=A0ABM1EDE7_PRICU|nr:PREDICTED: neuronal PAS domain-containing protein 2-like [Priapulus caudatus]
MLITDCHLDQMENLHWKVLDNSNLLQQTSNFSMNTRRAEKNRHAAKVRRDREMEVMTSLAEALPYEPVVGQQLDKASVFRLATAFLKLKRTLADRNSSGVAALPESCEELENESAPCVDLLDLLEGFLLMTNGEGDILYISDNVEGALGLSQMELLGHNVAEFVFPPDCAELWKQMSPDLTLHNIDEQQPTSIVKQVRNFYIRMQTLGKKQANRTRPSSYAHVHVHGHLRVKNDAAGAHSVEGLSCLCRIVDVGPFIEQPFVTGNMFMSRHNLECAFLELDSRVMMLIGYEPMELIGTTLFQFHSPLDVHKLKKCHDSLLKTGKAVSECYRFLGKTDAWIWMKTRASIIFNTNHQPQYIMCQNFILSESEAEQSMTPFMQSPTERGSRGLLNDASSEHGSLGTDTTTVATAIHPPKQSHTAQWQTTNAGSGATSTHKDIGAFSTAANCPPLFGPQKRKCWAKSIKVTSPVKACSSPGSASVAVSDGTSTPGVQWPDCITTTSKSTDISLVACKAGGHDKVFDDVHSTRTQSMAHVTKRQARLGHLRSRSANLYLQRKGCHFEQYSRGNTLHSKGQAPERCPGAKGSFATGTVTRADVESTPLLQQSNLTTHKCSYIQSVLPTEGTHELNPIVGCDHKVHSQGGISVDSPQSGNSFSSGYQSNASNDSDEDMDVHTTADVESKIDLPILPSIPASTLSPIVDRSPPWNLRNVLPSIDTNARKITGGFVPRSPEENSKPILSFLDPIVQSSSMPLRVTHNVEEKAMRGLSSSPPSRAASHAISLPPISATGMFFGTEPSSNTSADTLSLLVDDLCNDSCFADQLLDKLLGDNLCQSLLEYPPD